MLTRTSISVLLIIAVVVWGAFLWGLGIELTWEHAKPYSLTLATMTSTWWLFNKHLWKCWPGKWFINRPDLNGTWRVELQSTFQDPSTGDSVKPIAGYAIIRQTFSSLSIRLMTAQSESFLVASSVDTQVDGTTQIYGVYQNDPNILLRSKASEIHYGSFKYKVVGQPPIELDGHYWTDRNTNGSIKLSGRSSKHFDSYDLAEENM